ncbi:MAG TPA: NADH-quinone oxidoreductase subunit NuoK [Polyangia bacterium]|jgi:NADH-quinone oxidoreductase subunit K
MIPLGYYLVFALVLFCIGVVGVLLRRNVLIVLMSLELMLNAANLTLVAFARALHDMRGQVLAFLVIAVAAAEAAVGLAIVVAVFRTRRTAAIDEVNEMKF